MALTLSDVELLAALTDNPSYMLLLDKIKALVDDMTDRLHAADAESSKEIFPYWKALRTIYVELRDTPQEFANIIPDREEFDMEVKPGINNNLKELYHNLNKIEEKAQNQVRSLGMKMAPPGMGGKGFGNLI